MDEWSAIHFQGNIWAASADHWPKFKRNFLNEKTFYFKSAEPKYGGYWELVGNLNSVFTLLELLLFTAKSLFYFIKPNVFH